MPARAIAAPIVTADGGDLAVDHLVDVLVENGELSGADLHERRCSGWSSGTVGWSA